MQKTKACTYRVNRITGHPWKTIAPATTALQVFFLRPNDAISKDFCWTNIATTGLCFAGNHVVIENFDVVNDARFGSAAPKWKNWFVVFHSIMKNVEIRSCSGKMKPFAYHKVLATVERQWIKIKELRFCLNFRAFSHGSSVKLRIFSGANERYSALRLWPVQKQISTIQATLRICDMIPSCRCTAAVSVFEDLCKGNIMAFKFIVLVPSFVRLHDHLEDDKMRRCPAGSLPIQKTLSAFYWSVWISYLQSYPVTIKCTFFCRSRLNSTSLSTFICFQKKFPWSEQPWAQVSACVTRARFPF